MKQWRGHNTINALYAVITTASSSSNNSKDFRGDECMFNRDECWLNIALMKSNPKDGLTIIDLNLKLKMWESL